MANLFTSPAGILLRRELWISVDPVPLFLSASAAGKPYIPEGTPRHRFLWRPAAVQESDEKATAKSDNVLVLQGLIHSRQTQDLPGGTNNGTGFGGSIFQP